MLTNNIAAPSILITFQNDENYTRNIMWWIWYALMAIVRLINAKTVHPYFE